MRQNGPSRLAVVSVWPLLPLLSRQTSVEKPSEPASKYDFVVGFVCLFAECGDKGAGLTEFVFRQFHFARKVVEMAYGG